MKKVFIALFILLAVIRIFGHSLFHAPSPSRLVAHHTHQTDDDTDALPH